MNNNKVTYIQYNMNQLQFPTDLSEWIPKNCSVTIDVRPDIEKREKSLYNVK